MFVVHNKICKNLVEKLNRFFGKYYFRLNIEILELDIQFKR